LLVLMLLLTALTVAVMMPPMVPLMGVFPVMMPMNATVT
jgi:hypothetical protein